MPFVLSIMQNIAAVMWFMRLLKLAFQDTSYILWLQPSNLNTPKSGQPCSNTGCTTLSGVTIGRARRAVHAGPALWGGPKICPTLFFKSIFGEERALWEYLHAGPLQPCYATDNAVVLYKNRPSVRFLKTDGYVSHLSNCGVTSQRPQPGSLCPCP